MYNSVLKQDMTPQNSQEAKSKATTSMAKPGAPDTSADTLRAQAKHAIRELRKLRK